MTARAYVERAFGFDQIAVYLAERYENGRMRVDEPVEFVFRELGPEDEAVASRPSFRLSESMARELLDALAVYFGGTSEVQTLRKDYVAERGRVDKLTDAVIAIATGGQR